jgi:hypothetical protein
MREFGAHYKERKGQKTRPGKKLEKKLRARMKIVNDLLSAKPLRNLMVMTKCVFGFLFVC